MEQNILKNEIAEYLKSPINPELPPYKKEILEKMTGWLMAYAPGRYRQFARQTLLAPLPFRIAYINGQLEAIHRRLEEFGSVEKVEHNREKIVEQGFVTVENTDSLVRRISAEKPDVSPISKRAGRREDHEHLPEKIRACFEENLPLIQQIRSKHEKMKLYYRQLKDQRGSGAVTCDIEETVHALKQAAQEIVKLNDKRIENWQTYDNFKLEETPSPDPTPEPNAEAPTKVTVDPDTYRKLSSTNVSYISRYTGRLLDLSEDPAERVKYVNLKEEMQRRVNELLAAGWTWPESSKHKPILEKCGVKC